MSLLDTKDISDIRATIAAFDGAGLGPAGYYNFGSNTKYWQIATDIYFDNTASSEKFIVVNPDSERNLNQVNAGLAYGRSASDSTITTNSEGSIVAFIETGSNITEITLADARTLIDNYDLLIL